MKQDIDELDREILGLIQRDGLLSLQTIADKVRKLGKVGVSYRLKKLKENGVIQGVYAKLNAEKLGQDYIVIVRVACSRKGPPEQQTSREISRMNGVQSVYGTFGSFDILVIARSVDKKSARDLVYNLYKIPGVRSTETIVVHTVVKESLELALPRTNNENETK